MSEDRDQALPNGTVETMTGAIPLTVTGESVVPTNCVDAESFALRVIGDAFAPDLPDGCVIIIDPALKPHSGHYVLADLDKGMTLGALAERAGQWLLHPRGLKHAGIELQASQIRGVVSQRAGRRRSDHKRFA